MRPVALRATPARQGTGSGRRPEERFNYRRPVHALVEHRPGGRELRCAERLFEFAQEAQPRVAESLEGEVFQLRDEGEIELVDGMEPPFSGRVPVGGGELGAVPIERKYSGGGGEPHFDRVEDSVRLTYRFDSVALEEVPVSGKKRERAAAVAAAISKSRGRVGYGVPSWSKRATCG